MNSVHSAGLEKLPPGYGAVSAFSFAASSGAIVSMDAPEGVPSIFFHRFKKWGAVVFERPQRVDHPLRAKVVLDHQDATLLCEPLQAGPTRNDGICWQVLQRLEERSIEAAPDPICRRAANYMHELDLRTHPLLLNDRRGLPLPSEESDQVGTPFQTRFLSRCDHDLRDLPPVRKDAVCRLEPMLRGLMLDWFPGTAEEIMSAAAEAHILFGSGKLMTAAQGDDDGRTQTRRASNGGPNSAYIFAYPEFALAAIELGVEPEFWRAVLPGLAASCEAYLHCYGRLDAAGELVRASPVDYEISHQRIGGELREQLRKDYISRSTIELNKRLTQLIRRAFLCGASLKFMEHRPDPPVRGGHAFRYEWAPRRKLDRRLSLPWT